MNNQKLEELLQTRYTCRPRNIYIELDRYKFFHSPFSLDQKKEGDWFIGRKKILNRLRLILENSETKSGSYLVTGFRGMGKTSVVRKAIKEANVRYQRDTKGKGTKFVPIEISLAQDDLKEQDFLRLVARRLIREMDSVPKPNRRLKHTFKKDKSIRKRFKKVKKQLEKLNYRINAQLETSKEFGIEFGSGGENNRILNQIISGLLKSNWKKSTTANYPLAGIKEIEWELITILEDLDNIRSEYGEDIGNRGIPEFIFIFDELDKLEPYELFYLTGKESEDPLYDVKSLTDKIRRRNKAIASLLANLKNFLNTARAKFFFIGGREMFDASMADIADRDSFYSSIFHDVLYVESFFKDESGDKDTGLTFMTERYLAKILLPNKVIREFLADKNLLNCNPEWKKDPENIFTLKSCFLYLEELYKNRNDTQFDFIELYQVFFFLQHFVLYLCYRSNGTPKKLSGLFEDYLIPWDESILLDSQNLIIQLPQDKVDKNPELSSQTNQRLFLFFHDIDQYVISLTSAIYRPFIITYSRNRKEWSDSILFSTSYIIDHIFKFHPLGFSWRNLELIPEIITTNKSPQLREHMKDILSHYRNTYIRRTSGGLFQYKFYSKAQNELKYISKISELTCAAYNFTLDEYLILKRYYYKKLLELKKSHVGYERHDESSGYIHSEGFINSILGDLHFCDKEYEDAVIQYSEALQNLRLPKLDKLTEHQGVLLIFNKLKLSLTLEKLQSYESVVVIYKELLKEIPELFHEIFEKELNRRKKRNESFPNRYSTEKPTFYIDQYRGFRVLIQVYLGLLASIEKLRSNGITDFDIQEHEFLLKEFVSINDNFDQLRFSLYPGKFLKEPEKQEQLWSTGLASSLTANYFENAGSILFYKNVNFPSLIDKFKIFDPNFNELENENKGEGDDFEVNNHLLLKKYFNDPFLQGGVDFCPSVSAHVNYLEGISWVMNIFKDKLWEIKEGLFGSSEPNQDIFNIPNFEEEDGAISKYENIICIAILVSNRGEGGINGNQALQIGNLFTKLGDTILTFLNGKKVKGPNLELFKIIFDPSGFSDASTRCNEIMRGYNHFVKSIGSSNGSEYYNLDLVFLIYRVAIEFYLVAGNTYSYAFQFKKILYVLKDFLKIRKDSDDLGLLGNPESINLIKKNIAIPIFKAVSKAASVSNRPQMLKYEDMFNLKREIVFSGKENWKIIFKNAHTGPELWEVVLLVSGIQLKLAKKQIISSHLLDLKLDYVLKAPFSICGSKFARMFELKYKSDLNYFYFVEWKLSEMIPDLISLNENEQSLLHLKSRIYDFDKDLFEEVKGALNLNIQEDCEFLTIAEYLISDSIMNLSELIHILDINGPGYFNTYTFYGHIHYKLGSWCEYYRTMISFKNKTGEKFSTEIFEKLERHLGRKFMYNLDVRFHYELALNYFESSIEMHNGGKAYLKQLADTYYLEDDYNDNLRHFSASLERFKINAGDVRKYILKLRKKVEGEIQNEKFINGSVLYDYENYL